MFETGTLKAYGPTADNAEAADVLRGGDGTRYVVCGGDEESERSTLT
jgi:hypothetical protein